MVNSLSQVTYLGKGQGRQATSKEGTAGVTKGMAGKQGAWQMKEGHSGQRDMAGQPGGRVTEWVGGKCQCLWVACVRVGGTYHEQVLEGGGMHRGPATWQPCHANPNEPRIWIRIVLAVTLVAHQDAAALPKHGDMSVCIRTHLWGTGTGGGSTGAWEWGTGMGHGTAVGELGGLVQTLNVHAVIFLYRISSALLFLTQD